MRVGVAAFVGERLTEAREARGIMTMTSLADLLGVSTNAVSQYEHNICKPSSRIVVEMASKLKLKESFFFRPLPTTKANPIFWRSRHAATKVNRVVAERKLGWIKVITDDYLKAFLDLPASALPSAKELNIPSDPRQLTDDRIDQIALLCREYWDLGTMPIGDLTAFLENKGLLMTCGELYSEKLDAFSNVSEYDRSFHVFLGTGTSAVRSRFDAAHELGHLILHSQLSKEYLEDKEKTKKHSLIEHQAFRFASAFLMPAESFGGEVWMTGLEPLLSLKARWKVSVGAMIKRCDDLGMIPETHVRRLWISYNRLWKKSEPLDDEIPFEAPRLMKSCFDLLIESKLKTKADIRHDLPFSQRDIENLMNLPSGYLDDDFGQVRQLPSVKPSVLPASNDTGKIIPFAGKKKQFKE